ncbi:Uma2 family endonuclease [Thalassoporum mexicanum]|uniref:Uma2 family endonuclease n=1 Tax=Thalassoporum mexicanum TaxID=3457544 RepID=UPI0002EA6C30|nr:Uma2 family endonuclease [Pseudanabaena sp. PCC 7367]
MRCIYLLIEVADSSLLYDRNVKMPMYAAAGIVEFWLVDVEAQSIEVYRQPDANGYAETQIFKPGQNISLTAFPDVQIPVESVFPIGKGDKA